MKTISRNFSWRSMIALIVFSFFQIVSWGQDSPSTSSSSVKTTTTTTSSSQWYTAPWVWVVGGAVLILLLVAIVSGGSRSSRTSVTRTTDLGTGASTRTVIREDED